MLTPANPTGNPFSSLKSFFLKASDSEQPNRDSEEQVEVTETQKGNIFISGKLSCSWLFVVLIGLICIFKCWLCAKKRKKRKKNSTFIQYLIPSFLYSLKCLCFLAAVVINLWLELSCKLHHFCTPWLAPKIPMLLLGILFQFNTKVFITNGIISTLIEK